MRIEFNENGIFAQSGEANPKKERSTFDISNIFNSNLSLILGIVALVSSILNLFFGLFTGLVRDAIVEATGAMPWHLTTVFIILCVVITSISIICGIVSVVGYAKSTRQIKDGVGLTLSIVAFVISLCALIINVLGLFV